MKLLLPLTILFVLVAGCTSTKRSPDIIVTKDAALANSARPNMVNKAATTPRPLGVDPRSAPKIPANKTEVSAATPVKTATVSPGGTALSEITLPTSTPVLVRSNESPSAVRLTSAKSKLVSDEIDHSGAAAKCRDGSLSFSEHRRGTCSHHGGVTEWY